MTTTNHLKNLDLSGIDVYAAVPVVTHRYAAAVMLMAEQGFPVEAFSRQCHSYPWEASREPKWDWCDHIYRIAPSSRPKQFAPWARSDVPMPICWVRARSDKNRLENEEAMILRRNDSWVEVSKNVRIDYQELFDHFDYSTDGRTWKPCQREV